MNLKPQEIKLAEQLIKMLSQPFRPKQYHDEFQEKLRKLIEAKQHGKSVEIGAEPQHAPIIDMMTALKKSLAATSAAPAESKKAGRAKGTLQTVRKAS